MSGVWCLAGETLPRLVRTGAAGTRMLLLHNRPDTQHSDGGLGIWQMFLDVTQKHHNVLLNLAYLYNIVEKMYVDLKIKIFKCTGKVITSAFDSVTVLIVCESDSDLYLI